MSVDRKKHAVWEVYDIQRGIRYSKDYWTAKVAKTKIFHYIIEYTLMATAPGSAVAGLTLWTSDEGKNIWKALIAISAFSVIAKFVFGFAGRIEILNKVISQFRVIDFQVEALIYEIKREKKYTPHMVKEFKKIHESNGRIKLDLPVEKSDRKLAKRVFDLVSKQLPPENYYVPNL